MNIKILLPFFALMFATPLVAREKTDVLIMRNGDHLTCEVKNLDSNILYVSFDYMLGTISVDWAKVDHIESKQLFIVKTQNGLAYSGVISTTASSEERPAKIEVFESSTSKVVLEKDQINKMEETAQTFWQRLNGQIGLDSIYSKGNDSAQYNLNADVTYPSERWSASAVYSSNLSSSTGTSPATRNEFDLSAQRLLRWNNWYYSGLADFLQSSQQGIQLQSTYGGGIGRYLKNTTRASISLSGGFAWQRIEYEQSVLPSTTQQVTSAIIVSQVNLFYFDRTNLTATATLLPALSEPGRVHFNLNTSYYVKLWKNLTWNITFYGNWDNRPPPGFSGTDYGTSSGISWKFGNR